MSDRGGRFPYFDTLRAFAALSIFVLHAVVLTNIIPPGSWLRPYANQLNVGVSIFFVISGFLLYRPFVAARLAERTHPRVGAYAWRRFLRIFPAYWVALTVIAIVLPTPYVFSGAAPWFYSLFQLYHGPYILQGISQSWTLSVELSFYIFLPLYSLALGALARRTKSADRLELGGILALIVFSLAWKVVVLSSISGSRYGIDPLFMVLPNFLDQFALGMGLAWLSAHAALHGKLPAPLGLVSRRPWVAWVMAGVAFWAVSTRLGSFETVIGGQLNAIGEWRSLARSVLFSIVAVGVVAPAVVLSQARGVVGWVLARRPLLWVGRVSYGFYLWHLAVIIAILRWAPKSLSPTSHAARFLAVALGASLTIAALSYYIVERPALSLRRLVARGPVREPPAQVSAPLAEG